MDRQGKLNGKEMVADGGIECLVRSSLERMTRIDDEGLESGEEELTKEGDASLIVLSFETCEETGEGCGMRGGRKEGQDKTLRWLEGVIFVQRNLE